jgi:hypothetical protein
VLAAMVVRCVSANGSHDAASVLLTSLRDAAVSGS